jgi:hypothetical protein
MVMLDRYLTLFCQSLHSSVDRFLFYLLKSAIWDRELLLNQSGMYVRDKMRFEILKYGISMYIFLSMLDEYFPYVILVEETATFAVIDNKNIT